MTLDCNYYCCNHIVFWIYNVLLDVTWYFCNHIAVNEIMLHVEFCPSQTKQGFIHCLSHRIWSGIGWWSQASVSITHTFQHCSDTFTLLWTINQHGSKPSHVHQSLLVYSIITCFFNYRTFFQLSHFFLSFWDMTLIW